MATRGHDAAVGFMAWGALGAVIVACGPLVPPLDEGSAGSSTGTSTSTSLGGETRASVDSTGPKLDSPGGGSGPPCYADGTCDQLDVLVVIDNSGTMGMEQLGVARNLPWLLEGIQNLTDSDGTLVHPDVNLMVTTTDMGHPLCDPFQKPGYAPRRGAPVYDGCNARIERFTGLDPLDPLVVEEACTEGCPVDVVPDDPFIHFGMTGTNVPNDDVSAAWSCIGPQGFDGCGYGAPLESMLQALDEEACWNDPSRPECDAQEEWAETTRGFLRESAALVVVILSDGMDCSVAPDGYSFFTDDETYWSIDPALGMPRPSTAICVNAGVSCEDVDGDGIYESCTATDSGVLHPVERYTAFLEHFRETHGKEVLMLGVLGVPEVVAHDPDPPFEPIAGGVIDLIYHDWGDAPFPGGDILPDEWNAGQHAAEKAFELGHLAPGCTGLDQSGAFTAQAQPPVRMREVCESLDYVDDQTGAEEIRCCIESICDDDFSAVMRCLSALTERQVFAE